MWKCCGSRWCVDGAHSSLSVTASIRGKGVTLTCVIFQSHSIADSSILCQRYASERHKKPGRGGEKGTSQSLIKFSRGGGGLGWCIAHQFRPSKNSLLAHSCGKSMPSSSSVHLSSCSKSIAPNAYRAVSAPRPDVDGRGRGEGRGAEVSRKCGQPPRKHMFPNDVILTKLFRGGG